MYSNETQLRAAIVKALTSIGYWVVVHAVVGRTGPRSKASGEPGYPDLEVMKPHGYLEVKMPDGRVSDAQKAWHARAVAAGLRVAVVRSVRDAVEAVVGWAKRKEDVA